MMEKEGRKNCDHRRWIDNWSDKPWHWKSLVWIYAVINAQWWLGHSSSEFFQISSEHWGWWWIIWVRISNCLQSSILECSFFHHRSSILSTIPQIKLVSTICFWLADVHYVDKSSSKLFLPLHNQSLANQLCCTFSDMCFCRFAKGFRNNDNNNLIIWKLIVINGWGVVNNMCAPL